MGRIARACMRVAAGLAGLLLIALAAYFLVFPRTAAPDPEPYPRTAGRIERGRYLVEHVAMCLDCHSPRDWSRISGPPVAGRRGAGGPLDWLGDGKHAANITPGALGEWTDGEIARAIASGVSRDGRALHPMMPSDTYAALEREDLESIVVYIRTLFPVEGAAPAGEDTLPVRVIGRLLPKPYEDPPPHDAASTVERGAYLVRLADCGYCHRTDFAGGARFRIPGGKQVASANITPSKTGIGEMTRERFIGWFKSMAAPELAEKIVPPDGSNTVMPWVRLSGMTEEDLGAIYDYLRTLPPVETKPASKAVAGEARSTGE